MSTFHVERNFPVAVHYSNYHKISLSIKLTNATFRSQVCVIGEKASLSDAYGCYSQGDEGLAPPFRGAVAIPDAAQRRSGILLEVGARVWEIPAFAGMTGLDTVKEKKPRREGRGFGNRLTSLSTVPVGHATSCCNAL